jgi:hypothetical protein
MHFGRAASGELVPGFGTQFAGVIAKSFQQSYGVRIYLSGRLTAGTEGGESACTEPVENSLTEDAARGVAGAQKKDVPDLHYSRFSTRVLAPSACSKRR